MHILVTGGTGLIGRALVNALTNQGNTVTVLTRSVARTPAPLRAIANIVEALDQIDPNQSVDVVVNLAGAQIVGKRWSDKRKTVIRQSRVVHTRRLVEWISKQSKKPEVLISGSAVGFYGDNGETEIIESSSSGSDFGAELCVTWEAEAEKAKDLNIRVCTIRTGLVLSTDGGMLQQMLLPFKLGLGSQISNGQQWMSWIHIADEIGAIEKLIFDKNCSGPYNLTAPFPVRNKEFTKTLANALGRFSFLAAPAWTIKLILGESSELLLGGQRVLPRRLQQSGYKFQFVSVDVALQNLLDNPAHSNGLQNTTK